MNIGDVFLRILADDTGFAADVTKKAGAAGDQAGKTMGQRMAAGLKSNIGAFGKVAGTLLAGGLAVAAKGAAQLENIQADFIAQTGASAEEAAAAAKVINRVAGENRLSLEAVSEAAIRVRRDLGATGPEAERLTADFARFARVTKQDAGAAVSDFDDILDAYGLTAAEATGLQDKLLVSQQKFGGSITENQKALANFAPQLQALGVGVEEGIGLLNLFAASGLDSAKATFALNTAVKNLKPGQSLNDLIAQVSAIEDPTLRAQKAIEIFGARGGVSLANVLRPGIDSLEDFTISAVEAEGATQEAADAIDSTFTGRIQKAISQGTAALREFGAGFGPALTGLASLSTLAGSLGGGRLFGGLGRGLGGVGKKIGVRLAGAIGIGLASNVAADAVADGLSESVVGATKSSRLGGAVKGLGTSLGTRLGGFIGLGILAGIGGALAIGLKMIVDETNDQFKEAGFDDVEFKPAGMFDFPGQIANIQTGFDLLGRALRGEKPRLEQTAEDLGADTSTAYAEGVKSGAAGAEEAGASVAGAAADGMGGAPGAYRAGQQTGQAFIEGVTEKRDLANQAWDNLMSVIKGNKGSELAKTVGRLIGKDLAKALDSQDPLIKATAEDTQRILLDRLEETIPKSGKAGEDTMKALNKAIRSKDKDVSEEARRIKRIILDRLKEKSAAPAGKAVVNQVKGALNDGSGAIGRAAARLGRIIARSIITSVGSFGSGQTEMGGRRASGGPVQAFEAYTVGERGMELFVPRTDGVIIPHHQFQHAEAGMGMGGDTYNIPVQVQGALPVYTIRDMVTEMRRLGELRLLPSRTASPQYRKRRP